MKIRLKGVYKDREGNIWVIDRIGNSDINSNSYYEGYSIDTKMVNSWTINGKVYHIHESQYDLIEAISIHEYPELYI